MKARLRPIRSATLLPIRMNAADTSASSAIAPCTLETVVSRSSTTLEIDTFISDVSTTRTNMAIASRMARRLLPSGARSGMTRDAMAGQQLPDLGGHDDGGPGAEADEPLVARELDRVQEALEEAELGGEDDRRRRQQRRDDEGAVVERVQAEHRPQLVARGEREEQVRDREGRQRHRARELLALGMLRARRDPQRRGRHHQAGDHEPVRVGPLQDRLVGLARLALHQPSGGLAVTEADRL